MKRLKNLYHSIKDDLKSFVFWCLVFSLFRALFIGIYAYQLTDCGFSDILKSMLLGLRLSLKTSGMICLIGFVLALVPHLLLNNKLAGRIRWGWHSLCLLFFSVCFFTRIPYYKIFNAAFNSMVINGMYDDKMAIFKTAVEEYQFIWRLPAAIITGVVLSWLWRRFVQSELWLTVNIRPEHKSIWTVASIVAFAVFAVFVRYGGAFNYAKSINWESAARLKSNLLNEAILDDGQALYRVYAMKKKLDKIAKVDISPEQMRLLIAKVGGDAKANTISEAFARKARGNALQKQPNNILVIIGESFGAWPFQAKFQNLHLVDRMQALSKQGIYFDNMLANGSGTISAVNGIVSGLPDTGIYENYQPNSLKSKYETGIGYIMKQLGYKTVFWYGGFSGWQNIKNFVLAQSFDEFHCADEMAGQGGNSWGCPDEELFKYVNSYISKQGDEKVLHVILTTSNHPPYTIDVDKLGFPRAKFKQALGPDIDGKENTVNELGHFWYADKTMGDFVDVVSKEVPNSLFLITGDHSERFSFAKEQDTKILSAIPCIIYAPNEQLPYNGTGLAGSQMQIPATLAELVAPAGFEYSAISPSIFNGSLAFNYRLFVKNGRLEKIQDDKQVSVYSSSARNIAAWRVMKGNEIK